MHVVRIKDLINGLIVRNGVWITDIDGSVGENGAEERPDDTLRLVRTTDIAITDVEDDERMNLPG